MSDWTMWQLADSAFPAGGFAHSGGLEAAWQAGEIPDAASLRQFVRNSLGQAGRAALPLLNAAYDAPHRLESLDAFCNAFLSNAIANRASRVQGRAFGAACVRTWPLDAVHDLDRRSISLCGHLAPLFGAVTRALDCSRPEAQRLLLHLTARGVLSAAVRLGVVGPYAAQQMQADCVADFERVLARCGRLTEHDIAQTAPLMDIVQGTHDRLYSRLFQS